MSLSESLEMSLINPTQQDDTGMTVRLPIPSSPKKLNTTKLKGYCFSHQSSFLHRTSPNPGSHGMPALLNVHWLMDRVKKLRENNLDLGDELTFLKNSKNDSAFSDSGEWSCMSSTFLRQSLPSFHLVICCMFKDMILKSLYRWR